MAQGSSYQQARHAVSAICRIVGVTWKSNYFSWPSASPFSSFAAAKFSGSRGFPPDTYTEEEDTANDEFWVVEGEILRVRGGIEKNKLKMAVRPPPSENLNLSRKQVAKTRHDRVMAARLSKSERGQEEYWKTYLKRYQRVQNQWEKLYFDEVPKMVKPAPVPTDKNDPFTILGLKRREKPYSPVELKSAYREMALKYHPDHNPGRDAEVRFEKIWNAYKMLQHKRSWR